MKTIFYIGGHFLGSTGNDRRRALEDIGYAVESFDTDPYFRSRSNLEQKIFGPIRWSPMIAKMNRSIVELIEKVDYDFTWVSKGLFIFPDTVEVLKKYGRKKAIHYTPDSHMFVNKSRHLFRSIEKYDVCITTKSWEVELYKKWGAKKVILAPKSVDLDRFGSQMTRDQSDCLKFKSDVCFVGHYEDHYLQTVGRINEMDVSLKVWGPWLEYSGLPRLQNVVAGNGAWGSDYVRALASAKIGLGLLSKKFPETITQRSLEIPASGTFMLAERTDDHLNHFEEGKEAEFFSGVDELKDKIHFYLTHDSAREKIARAGRLRCERSGYDNRERLKLLLDQALK